MSYLYTGSSTQAATATGLSTQIIIKVNGKAVGAIQTLSTSQSRPLKRITEVGTDRTVEIVPTSITEISLRVSRIYFDRKSLPVAFQRGFVNIHAQRYPFDIFIYDFSNVNPTLATEENAFDAPENAEGVVTTVYENCWFKSLSTSYNTGDYIITQDADLDAEFVRTFQGNNPQQSAASGSTPEINDPVERAADTGGRGSLDARGLNRLGEIFDSLID